MDVTEFASKWGEQWTTGFIHTDMGKDFIDMLESLAPVVPESKKGDPNMALDFMGAEMQHRNTMRSLKSIKAAPPQPQPLEANFRGPKPGDTDGD